jgi:predicted O-methyltransferase YrrM
VSEKWTAVDDFINSTIVEVDAVLTQAEDAAAKAGLPQIAVSPAQGKLLQLIAKMVKVRRILEIGTLGGYSTIWMARALPADGHLLTLELDPHHAEVARGNLAGAGLAERAEVRLGAALDTLAELVAEGVDPYDLIFIDADKSNIPGYLDWSLKLSRPGTVIIVDNVVRNGGLADGTSTDPNVVGVRRLHEILSGMTDRLSATSIQTVGSKGYDGFTLVLVEG